MRKPFNAGDLAPSTGLAIAQDLPPTQQSQTPSESSDPGFAAIFGQLEALDEGQGAAKVVLADDFRPEPDVITGKTRPAWDRWTWDRAEVKNRISKLIINKDIRAWMDHDPDFHNWVKTCVAQHVENERAIETICPIPDRWRDTIGDQIAVVTSNCLPRRKGEIHQVVEGVYHVMS